MRRYKAHNKGFTLIEILVVLAISVILMGLVMYPVIQSFKLTRRAEAMVEAQDSARQAMSQISRELGQAVYVYDNANSPINMPVALDGNTRVIKLQYAKIDMVLPKLVMHCNREDHPASEPRDYSRKDPTTGIIEAWPLCPACINKGIDVRPSDVEAIPKLPLEQDTTIVRYFLGLQHNDVGNGSNYGWASPFDSNVPPGEENQVVLYRVEFSVYDNDLFPSSMSVSERLSDPDFFYRSGYTDKWAKIARVVGLGKYEDLVRVVDQDSNGYATALDPTITFKCSRMDNDTFASVDQDGASSDYPNAIPSLYRATYGYWTPDNQVTVYRDDYNTAYSTGFDDSNDHLMIYKWVKNGSSWDQTPEFDITEYQQSGDLSAAAKQKPLEMAFTIDPNRGTVDFAVNPPTGNSVVSQLDPSTINNDAHSAAVTDRASIVRCAPLIDQSSGSLLEHACIVPGSERVVGPDARHNDNYGKLVRYVRNPLYMGGAELNQYQIDYSTGYIYFWRMPNDDIPTENPINVSFKVQFNKLDDIVRGDYSTKSLVDVHMGMRLFDPDSNEPHAVDLNNSVKVRNALR